MSFSQSNSGSFIPRYGEEDWLLQLAREAQRLEQQQYAWGQQQFARNSQLTDEMVHNYLSGASTAYGAAQNDLSRYQNMFQPEENQLLADANTYASGSRIASEMGRAEATAGQAGDAGRQNTLRDLQSYGIDPSSGRYASLDAAERAQTAAAQAGAGNQSRLATEAAGRGLRSEAIQVGQRYPGQVANELNSAMQGFAGAENATLANTASGLSMLGNPQGYLQAGMGLRYPPLGSLGSSQGANGGGGGGSRGGGSSDPGNIMGGYGSSWHGGNDGFNANPTNYKGDQSGWLMNQKSSGFPSSGRGGLPHDEMITDPSGDGSSWDSGSYNNYSAGRDTGWGSGGLGNYPGGSWDNPVATNYGDVSGTGDNASSTFDASQPGLGDYTSGGWDGGGGDQSLAGGGDESFAGGGVVDPYSSSYNPFSAMGGAGGDPYAGKQPYGAPYDMPTSQPGSIATDSGPGGTTDPLSAYGLGGSLGDNRGPGGEFTDPNTGQKNFYLANGGSPSDATTGGFIDQSASPSGGAQTDDVSARVNAYEYVVPRDVTLWKGQEFFQKLIDQSRQARQAATAKPQMKPAINQAPTFQSRPAGRAA